MKLIYNNKEVANNTKNYNELLNKPLLNSKELVGNISLNDINVYNKKEVDNLIASTRSVKAVTALPSPLVENTMYYVGPDADNNYHVYLVDSALTLIDLGMAREESMYKAGAGIEIDSSNNIMADLDYETVSLNSEGKIYVPTLEGTKGSDTKPVYLNDGQITASAGTVGSTTKGAYLDNGTITPMTYELKSTVNSGTANKLAYYSGANAVSSNTSTVGGLTKGIYLNAGVPTEMTYNVNSTVNSGTANKLAYYSGANAISSYASTVGSTTRPVYVTNGVITATAPTVHGFKEASGISSNSAGSACEFGKMLFVSGGCNINSARISGGNFIEVDGVTFAADCWGIARSNADSTNIIIIQGKAGTSWLAARDNEIPVGWLWFTIIGRVN